MAAHSAARGRHRAGSTTVVLAPVPVETFDEVAVRGRHRQAPAPGRSHWRSGAVLGTLSAATVIAVVQAPSAGTGDSQAEAATQQQPGTPQVSPAELAYVTKTSHQLDAIAAAQKAAKAAAAQRAATLVEATRSAQRNARPVGRALALKNYGWGSGQFVCLDQLWTRESNWHYYADNPSSSAYGIAQALPGSKMASAGPDWQTNPVTQILWGLGYVHARYGTPCGAWAHETSAGWY